MPESVESRLAVASAEIDSIQREVEKLRDRCHKLESDRATLRVLHKAVTDLSEQMPNLARQAAREAVREAKRQEDADRKSNWRTYAAMISAGAAFGALIIGLLLR